MRKHFVTLGRKNTPICHDRLGMNGKRMKSHESPKLIQKWGWTSEPNFMAVFLRDINEVPDLQISALIGVIFLPAFHPPSVTLIHSSVWSPLKENKCPVQTTDWSPCSRSCGMGVSSRLTNKNPQCKMERQTRICTIRPCHSLAVPAKVRWTERDLNKGMRQTQTGTIVQTAVSLPR